MLFSDQLLLPPFLFPKFPSPFFLGRLARASRKILKRVGFSILFKQDSSLWSCLGDLQFWLISHGDSSINSCALEGKPSLFFLG